MIKVPNEIDGNWLLNDEERAYILCALNHYRKCPFANQHKDAKELLKKSWYAKS